MFIKHLKQSWCTFLLLYGLVYDTYTEKIIRNIYDSLYLFLIPTYMNRKTNKICLLLFIYWVEYKLKGQSWNLYCKRFLIAQFMLRIYCIDLKFTKLQQYIISKSTRNLRLSTAIGFLKTLYCIFAISDFRLLQCT